MHETVRGMGTAWRRWCVALALMLCLPTAIASLRAAGVSEQFHRSSWHLKDGAPADIWAMLQGQDGYLWLGTGSGIYRFDGVKFERFLLPSGQRLPSDNITAMTQLPDGEVWLGYYSGGAGVIRNGKLINYSAREGFPDALVYNFSLGRDGVLWAATADGLVRFVSGRWQIVGPSWSYPARRAQWSLIDVAGNLWVTTGERLVVLPRGAHAFLDTGVAVGDSAVLAQAPDGLLWLSDGLHGTRALPGLTAEHLQRNVKQPPATTTFGQAKRLLFDKQGRLWATDALQGGIFEVTDPARASDGHALQPDDLNLTVNRRDGLTADFAVPLVQDREGTVWVGTNLGLNSFRQNNIIVPRPITVGPSSHFAAAADADGTVWIINAGTLFRAEHGELVAVMDGLPDIGSAQAAGHGLLWLVGKEIHRLNDGRVVSLPWPDGASAATPRAMVPDRSGGLWVAFVSHGIQHFAQGQWRPLTVEPSVARSEATSLAVDASGHLWIGYSGNRVAMVDGEVMRVFTEKDGLRIGNVASIHAAAGDVLFGGSSGLARLHRGTLQSISSQQAGVLAGISGIAESADGDVWLNGSKGVVRIHKNALNDAFDHPETTLDYRLFDDQDGLPGIALQENESPTAMADSDGRLWFATNQGVAWIDPARLHRNLVPPPLDIQSLTAGERTYLPSSSLVLPRRTSNVQIAYTALSLSIPERVHFRYRLDSVDDQWLDAGTRREVFYTNLGPGRHRFQVIAANDDGVWNRQGASIKFYIEPMFYQTGSFIVLCVLLGAALLLVLFLLRLRQMTLRVRDRLHERHMERERIARELHDTLLQSVQGLVLRFQAVAERLPPASEARSMIEKALDRADDVLVEGRDRVHDLRVAAHGISSLSRALAALGEELGQGKPVEFRVIMEGAVRKLDPMVRDELYRIGREAISNAFAHARAGAIEVEINHDPDFLRLRVRDDGVGIDQRVVDDGSRPGHWGLAGMRERAARMGATLDIWGGVDLGTEVDVKIPASVAYGDSSHGYMNWLIRLVSGGRDG